MNRGAFDDLMDDLEQAWAEPVPAKAREMYAHALEGIDLASARRALRELLLEARERRPPPGVLRARALAFTGGGLPETDRAVRIPEVQTPTNQRRPNPVNRTPVRQSAAPRVAGAPWLGTVPTGGQERPSGRSGLSIVLWMAAGGIGGSAVIGAAVSLLWVGVSGDPPESMGAISGAFGLVAGLVITWAILAATARRRGPIEAPSAGSETLSTTDGKRPPAPPPSGSGGGTGASR